MLQPYKSFVMVCAGTTVHKPRQAFATLRRGFKGLANVRFTLRGRIKRHAFLFNTNVNLIH